MAADAGDELSIDLREIREEIGDARLLRKVLNDYCTYLLDQSKGLENACRRGEENEVRRIAHAIRGGASVLRAKALEDTAAAVERKARLGTLSEGDFRIAALVTATERACHELSLLLRGWSA